MRTRSSREIIHTCLESNHVDLLLAAAIQAGGDAHFDSDVFRALMQLALQEGDLETVRQASTRMLEVALGLGLLPMALEAICLFRNVGGDATALIDRVIEAVEARGFSAERLPHYVEWVPDLSSFETPPTCPPPADALAMLMERPAPRSDAPFAWISFWAQLPIPALRQLMEWMHFELRRSGEAVLSPPRLAACWLTTGSVRKDEEAIRTCPPGTMIVPRVDATIEAASHLRMVGLRDSHWETVLSEEPFASTWRKIDLRHRMVEHLLRLAHEHRLPQSAVDGWLRGVRVRSAGDAIASLAQDTVIIALDGQLPLPNGELAERGEVVVLPSGEPPDYRALATMQWSVSAFEGVCPLSVVEHRRVTPT